MYKFQYGGQNLQILNTRKTAASQQQISQILTPEIMEDNECRQCAQRANIPDTTTIHILTNDILVQYTGKDITKTDGDHQGYKCKRLYKHMATNNMRCVAK